MEEFKEKLRINTLIFSIAVLILACFSLLGFIAEEGIITLIPATGDSHWHSMWHGFMSGVSSGIMLVMVFCLIKNVKALKNDEALKKLYIKENDERQMQIWTAARATSMQIFLIFGIVAGIIAGYFNATVSITIIACVFVHSLIGMAFKLYYNIKF